MLMWLKVSGIRKGPIFPKIRSGEVLKAGRLQSFSYDQKTMDQWVTDSNGLVHLSYDDFSSVISHLFGIVVTVYNKPDYARVTPYSFRRSACVWSSQCGAKECEIRFAGRWSASSRHFSIYMEEGTNMYNLTRNENEIDPIRKMWVWKPCNFGDTVDACSNSKKIF